jgi:hypothetical protein
MTSSDNRDMSSDMASLKSWVYLMYFVINILDFERVRDVTRCVNLVTSQTNSYR